MKEFLKRAGHDESDLITICGESLDLKHMSITKTFGQTIDSLEEKPQNPFPFFFTEEVSKSKDKDGAVFTAQVLQDFKSLPHTHSDTHTQ